MTDLDQSRGHDVSDVKIKPWTLRFNLNLEEARKREEEHFLRYNHKSLPLIRASSRRGMSRAAMERIWGFRLVKLVLEG